MAKLTTDIMVLAIRRNGIHSKYARYSGHDGYPFPNIAAIFPVIVPITTRPLPHDGAVDRFLARLPGGDIGTSFQKFRQWREIVFGGRITERGMHHILAMIGKRFGIVLRPHGIRHTAITEVVKVTARGGYPSITQWIFRDMRKSTRSSNITTAKGMSAGKSPGAYLKRSPR